MRTCLAFFLAVAVSIGPAFAGGVAPAAPVAAAPTTVEDNSWSGAYVGVTYSANAHLDESLETFGFVADFEGDLSGIFGGIRHDFGDIVVGLEVASLSGALPRDTVAPGVIVTGGGPDVRINRLGAEVGYDFGRILAYGTAGTASAYIEFPTTFTNRQGMFFGVGADFQVFDNLLVGAQWTVYEFYDDGPIPLPDFDLETLELGIAITF